MFSVEGTDENTGEINVSKSAQAAVDRQVAEFRAEQTIEIGYPSTYSKEKTAEVRYDERRTARSGESRVAGETGGRNSEAGKRYSVQTASRPEWSRLEPREKNKIVQTIESYAAANDEIDFYLDVFADGDVSSPEMRRFAFRRMAEAFYTAMGGNRILLETDPRWRWLGRDLPSLVEDIESIASDDKFVQEYKDSHEGVMYSERDYTYEALINKPDMVVTTVGGTVPTSRADVVAQAKKNAAKVGKFDPKTGSVSVHVDDIGVDVILATKGLRHGLRRTDNPEDDLNWIVTLKSGEIIKNAVRINELVPSKDDASKSYVLIGAARNQAGDMCLVRFVVNQFSFELTSMDVLYAIKAKELAATKSPRLTAKPLSVTSSTISIAELLDHVNQYFPDILPEDVLKHFGHSRRPDGDLGEDALYQEREVDSVSNRSLLANALDSAAQTESEKKRLDDYRKKIDSLNEQEARLNELNAQIREKSFAKGPRDTAGLNALRDEKVKTVNRINSLDGSLLRLEATKPLQNLLEREKAKAYARAKAEGRQAQNIGSKWRGLRDGVEIPAKKAENPCK